MSKKGEMDRMLSKGERTKKEENGKDERNEEKVGNGFLKGESNKGQNKVYSIN